MKEYKYKINGNSYKVTIGDIEDNIAHVWFRRCCKQGTGRHRVRLRSLLCRV